MLPAVLLHRRPSRRPRSSIALSKRLDMNRRTVLIRPTWFVSYLRGRAYWSCMVTRNILHDDSEPGVVSP